MSDEAAQGDPFQQLHDSRVFHPGRGDVDRLAQK
jgi:hypothetical protein